MSILKRLSLCFLFVSLLLIPSFAQHFLGALSGLVLQVDTQIESPVQNNNVQTLPEQKAGDTIQFQFFVPAGAGQSTNGYTLELDLPGKTFSNYIGNVSGTDWTGGALINTVSTKLSALFPTGASVPSTGYLGQADLQVTRSLEGGATLIVKSLSITSGSDVDVLDVSNAIITFTAPATGPGDFDGNGIVNLADFLLFVAVFNKSSSDVGFDARMDFDGNGIVNIADFLAFVEVFGTTYPTGGGQSGGDSNVIPPPPDNAQYQWDPSTSLYQIFWDPSPNATSYRVYYDSADLLDVSCPGGCRQIANVSNTTFAHFSSHGIIGYWVRACNDAGCSNYVRASRNGDDSSAPPSPDNVRYWWDTSIYEYRISWDPSPGATSYRVYYDSATFFNVSCPGGCRRIATVGDTTITHISSHFKIGYWVRACDDANCSNYVRASYVRASEVGGYPPTTTIFELDTSHDSPKGITYANDRFYVVDDISFRSGKVYAYLSSGQRDTVSDFDLSPQWTPEGITYANDRFYVVDDYRDKVFAYLSSGQRDPASDFDLSSNTERANGITHANNRFYVVDDRRDKVFAYMSSGQRDPASDFDLSPQNWSSEGITYANDRFYVVDGHRYKVFAYMGSGQRDPASDFNLSPERGSPRGITYANGKFYLVVYSIVYEVDPQ